MILVEPGESFPLTLTLEDGKTDRFPRAQMLDETGSPLGSPVDLTHRLNGTYTGTATAPATAGQFPVNFTVYDDAGHTTVSPRYGRTDETVVVASLASTAADVWDVLRTASVVPGSFGEAVKVLFGVAGKSNYRIDLMVYDPNGFLSSARLRVFPDAATAAASTKDAVAAEGEIATITLTGSPDGTFSVLPSTVLGIGP